MHDAIVAFMQREHIVPIVLYCGNL